MSRMLLVVLVVTLTVSGWTFFSNPQEAGEFETITPIRSEAAAPQQSTFLQVDNTIEEGEIRDLFPYPKETMQAQLPVKSSEILVALPPAPPPVKYLGRKLDGKNDLAILEVNGIPQIYQKGDIVESNWKLEDFGPHELVLRDVRDQSMQRLNMGS